MRYPVKWASRLTSIRFLYASTVSLSSRLACKHKFSILKDVMHSPDIATLNTHFRLGISRYTYLSQSVCLAPHCFVGQPASYCLIPIVSSSGALLLLLIGWPSLFIVQDFTADVIEIGCRMLSNNYVYSCFSIWVYRDTQVRLRL